MPSHWPAPDATPRGAASPGDQVNTESPMADPIRNALRPLSHAMPFGPFSDALSSTWLACVPLTR